MIYQLNTVAIMGTLLATHALAGGGIPASNPPNTTCQNTWETVTNDPVVQYWYMVVPNSGVKADRMWNHLNLNGCAPTENKYYSTPGNDGIALTFHTSEACTAQRVSNAYRSSSSPPYNVACEFTGKDGVNSGEAGATALSEAFDAVLEAFGGE